jgi:hypothetical protein
MVNANGSYVLMQRCMSCTKCRISQSSYFAGHFFLRFVDRNISLFVEAIASSPVFIQQCNEINPRGISPSAGPVGCFSILSIFSRRGSDDEVNDALEFSFPNFQAKPLTSHVVAMFYYFVYFIQLLYQGKKLAWRATEVNLQL